MVRYNLKESIRDYSTYQSYASKICSKYVVKEVSKTDKNVHLLNQTLLGGEIILPCIVYVHRDGSISNAYPLVGRAKLGSDAELVSSPFELQNISITFTNVTLSTNQATPWTSTWDYEFTSPVETDWFLEVQDTGVVRHTIVANQTGHYTFDGHFDFPDVYLVTPFGKFLVKENLHNEGTFSFNIGLEEIEKWKIQDSSVRDTLAMTGYVSSGQFGYYESSQLYTNPPNYCGEDYWGKDCDGNDLEDTPVRLFVVPDRSVERHMVNDTIRPIGIWFEGATIEYPNDDVVSHYFTLTIVNNSNIVEKGIAFPVLQNHVNKNIEPFYNATVSNNDRLINFVNNGVLIENVYVTGDLLYQEGFFSTNLLGSNVVFDNFDGDLPYNSLNLTRANVDVVGYTNTAPILVEVDDVINILPRTFVSDMGNLSLSNTFSIVKTVDDFDTLPTKYVSIRNYINPIPNIWSIRTRRVTELGNNVSFKGNYFIAPLMVDNVATLDIMGNNLLEIITFQDAEIQGQYETLTGFFVESKVNGYVRHNGIDECNTIYVSGENNSNTQVVLGHGLTKVIERYNNSYRLRDSICPFFGGYNQDYSYIQELNKYNSLNLTFDFCSECTGLYPHIWSISWKHNFGKWSNPLCFL